ncbi:MAG: FixH family protein [Burkholderiales bacterium]|jgi:hypothetical protein
MNIRTLEKPGTPWYREPWPWILIGLPLSAVIAGIATLIIAIQHEDGLVAEDYYKQGLAINRVLARESRASELGLTANLMFAADQVRIRLQGSGQFPDRLRARFVHPTRAGEDREITMDATAPGWYEGTLPPLAEGHWRVQIEDAQSTWRMTGSWTTSQGSLLISAADATR